MLLEPGSRLGDYEVLRLLGKGGMGEVYLARDGRLGREVALKILPGDLREDEDRRRRFLREAKLASRLVHPNAAVIYEAGNHQGCDFLVMEYVKGQPLNRRLSQGQLPLDELLEVSEQLADVTAAAHECGIVHRDIKPGNIILTAAGQAKLLDFGLARLEPSAISQEDSTVTAATAPGMALGTLAYMSPEQVRGRGADARSDIFALGVVFYEMATGRQPFAGENATSTIANILQQAPQPILRWNYEIPSEYERIVRKCLEKDPKDRYQSAQEIRIDLRNLRRTSQTREPSVAQPATAGGGLARRGLLGVGAAGAVALAAAGGWFWAHLPRLNSLAVLPLAYAGPQDLAYLSDGLTESLINSFSVVPQLRVLARSTVYNKRVPVNDPVAAGKTLAVAAVMAGRVESLASQVRIALSMIATADGRQIWGSVAEIETGRLESAAGELAQQALGAMGLGNQASAPKPARAYNSEAYQAYLRGRYQMNKRTRAGIEKALDEFKQAQDYDAAYALPYAGMALALVLKSGFSAPKDVFPMAEAAAQHALELDPSLPEAHAMLGVVRLYYQWDWAGAETEMRRALDLNPNYAAGHSNYSQLLICRKRFPEAVAQVSRAADLDPLSPAHAYTLGYVYYQARQFDRAIGQLGKAIANDRNSPVGYFYRGTAYLAESKFAQSIADFDTGLKLAPDNGAIADQGMAYARSGNAEKAREAIRHIEASAQQRYVSPHLLAFPYIGLGEMDRAMDCLERAAEERSGWVAYLGVEPKLDPLRPNARFQQLMKLVGV